jgi:hypothetical protein
MIRLIYLNTIDLGIVFRMERCFDTSEIDGAYP